MHTRTHGGDDLERRLRAALDAKTKPVGALGRLEDLAVRLGTALGTDAPDLVDPQVLVCAGDHGLAAHGVSAYPPEVTAQMVRGFVAGSAAVSVLARQHGLDLVVVDCGVRTAVAHPRVLDRRVGAGTADAATGPAMTVHERDRAVANGREIVSSLPGNVVLLGEMGIGNTSSATLLTSLLLDVPVRAVVGPGTGVEGGAYARKLEVLERVQRVHRDAQGPLDTLARVGGFEIATLVGAVLQAADERRVVVVDGFVSTAALLVAERVRPGAAEVAVASHLSPEPGHGVQLEALDLAPLLDLGLRLGEASGAVLAWPLLRSACAVLAQMATFEAAGVSGPVP